MRSHAASTITLRTHPLLRGGTDCLPHYLSIAGKLISDRINLVYSDLHVDLTTDFATVAKYVRELKEAAANALTEESVIISVEQVYHYI